MHGKKFLFNPSCSLLLSFSIAAKFHDLTAKESALTNASLQDQLMTSDGRFVIDIKYSCMTYSEILFVTEKQSREKSNCLAYGCQSTLSKEDPQYIFSLHFATIRHHTFLW